jgi:hypothetical protein
LGRVGGSFMKTNILWGFWITKTVQFFDSDFLKYLEQWLVDSVFKIHRTGGSLKNQRTTQYWLGTWVVV